MSTSMFQDSYVLNVGEADNERLLISNSVYGPASRSFLRSIGLNKGQRVLEVGCGSGNMTCWIADQVRNGGSVVGVDISDEQLDVAKKRAAANRLENVSFVSASVGELGSIPGGFDLIYCRFLLIHLPDPMQALEKMKQKLVVGGILGCEEPTTSTHLCFPNSSAFDRANELTIMLGKKKGVDYNLGVRLYELFRRLDLDRPLVSFTQPCIPSGYLRKIFPMSLEQTKQKIIDSDLAEASELDGILHSLWQLCEDESALVAGFRNTQAWGSRK